MTLEVCIDIPQDTEVEGEIKKKIMPWWKYAVLHTELTNPKEYWPAWIKVVDRIKENNMEIDMSRPSYEFYLNNPEEHPKKHHIVDICMSIK
jgi:AraC family transcriptional regulator